MELVLRAPPDLCADFEGTVALCAQRNVAVQTIKALARGPWAAGTDRNRETWYQPLEDEADIRAGRISITSPIARALVGKTEGDVVDVDAPGGVKSFEVVSVHYE